MTKKDFELIARVFAGTRPGPGSPLTAAVSQWHYDVNTMAHALALANPGFKRDRFVTACQA